MGDLGISNQELQPTIWFQFLGEPWRNPFFYPTKTVKVEPRDQIPIRDEELAGVSFWGYQKTVKTRDLFV